MTYRRAEEIAAMFVSADDPKRRHDLMLQISKAIEEAQRQSQSWRPLEIEKSHGATLRLHCTQEGAELHAFNPITGHNYILSLEPLRKPAGREVLKHAAKAGAR